FPNPWRVKANGRVIIHMPITLYSDDTSGNISKQWNKHISYYCSLAGLPPSETNQQYNCHFLSTSNTAGVLELADQIVDEINDLITKGFVGYDIGLNQEVLVMTAKLCFLGDSPMHSEVTNTPNPRVSLNPCRICTLKVQRLVEKSSLDYVLECVGLNHSVERVCGFQMNLYQSHYIETQSYFRKWTDTIEQTHKLWDIALKDTKTAYNDVSKDYGIQDNINDVFLQQWKTRDKAKISKIELLKKEKEGIIFNPFLRLKGFDGCNDTPVEVLHVFLFNPDALDLAHISGKYFVKQFKSLVGKHFKMLCHLAPYVFQTSISNLEKYLEEIEQKIEIFLHNVIKISARWLKKPKFHMLVHLPHSIRRFVPASLFATEKFESFNSILRKASVHSNRHWPGRDLAFTFADYESMQAVLSASNHAKFNGFKGTHTNKPETKNIPKRKYTKFTHWNNFVAQINSIWAIESSLHTEYEFEGTHSHQIQLTHPRFINTTLNFQQNCHSGHC
ncbi:hypothetical protein VP01_4324g1, partial [Puccinia sorghi]